MVTVSFVNRYFLPILLFRSWRVTDKRYAWKYFNFFVSGMPCHAMPLVSVSGIASLLLRVPTFFVLFFFLNFIWDCHLFWKMWKRGCQGKVREKAESRESVVGFLVWETVFSQQLYVCVLRSNRRQITLAGVVRVKKCCLQVFCGGLENVFCLRNSKAVTCHFCSGWRRGSVVRMSFFSWWTFPNLCLICGWQVTISW